jgi:NADH-quinone oxidoreductase subunit N
MPDTIASVDFGLLWPEFAVTVLAFLVLTADFFLPPSRKDWLAVISVAGLLVVAALTVPLLWNTQEELFGGIVRIDRYAVFFKLLFLGIGVFVILASVEYVRKRLDHPGEYYAIVLFSVLAMMLLAMAGELLTAYISLELLSFSLYILAGYAREEPKSNEAGVKYILLGAFSSALLLYGISLLYGALGTTSFAGMAEALEGIEGVNGRLLLGMAFLVAGLGFKLAAAPFHMWAPDVYEGAPLPITAYIAVGSKAAAFALVLRLFSEGFLPAADQWRVILAVMAALTMTVGNLVALTQSNIKRMLAYSSVGQVGYLLMGVAALSPLASAGLLLHLVGYSVTNMAAFTAITAFHNQEGKEEISDLAGLGARSPFLAAVLTLSFFSLAGLPFFAGFTTKFYLFAATAAQGLLWLAGLAMLASLISLYYYLMVIKQMYIGSADGATPVRVPVLMRGSLVLLVLAIIVIGVYPAPLVDAIWAATAVLPLSSVGFVVAP